MRFPQPERTNMNDEAVSLIDKIELPAEDNIKIGGIVAVTALATTALVLGVVYARKRFILWNMSRKAEKFTQPINAE